jgi:hypothetical protein
MSTISEHVNVVLTSRSEVPSLNLDRITDYRGLPLSVLVTAGIVSVNSL